MIRRIALCLLLIFPGTSLAEELLMARIARPFPETMNLLQDTIRAKGYTISRVQRVDVGLTSSGFQTAEYRLVFFAIPDELKRLSAQYIELIPYLPLNIVIYAEGDDTILLTLNPHVLRVFFDKPELHHYFSIWENDLRYIFDVLSVTP